MLLKGNFYTRRAHLLFFLYTSSFLFFPLNLTKDAPPFPSIRPPLLFCFHSGTKELRRRKWRGLFFSQHVIYYIPDGKPLYTHVLCTHVISEFQSQNQIIFDTVQRNYFKKGVGLLCNKMESNRIRIWWSFMAPPPVMARHLILVTLLVHRSIIFVHLYIYSKGTREWYHDFCHFTFYVFI